MYLFVFFWSPALKAVSSTPLNLPFGMIFACFMVCLQPEPHFRAFKLSNFYLHRSHITLYYFEPSSPHIIHPIQLDPHLSHLSITQSASTTNITQCSVMLGSLLFSNLVSARIISHSRLLTLIFATGSSALLIPILSSSEVITFWSFCIFEACVGMYWPSVSTKSPSSSRSS